MKRRTKQRDEVRELLDRTPRFASAQEVYQALRDSGSAIGLATVYRALTALAGEGIADSLTRDGETVYRACRPGHHHHLLCRNCGATTEISAEPVEAWAASVATAHGYRDPEHVVDVFGLCPDCQKTSTGN